MFSNAANPTVNRHSPLQICSLRLFLLYLRSVWFYPNNSSHGQNLQANKLIEAADFTMPEQVMTAESWSEFQHTTFRDIFLRIWLTELETGTNKYWKSIHRMERDFRRDARIALILFLQTFLILSVLLRSEITLQQCDTSPARVICHLFTFHCMHDYYCALLAFLNLVANI